MDGTNNAITFIDQSVFSSPIQINGARWTGLSNGEFGASINANAGAIAINGSFGFGSITVTGGAAKVGAGNYNISW